MRFRKTIAFLLACAALHTMAQLPVGRDTITVLENGKVLHLGWAGGLNSCMFSHLDANQDGKQDLVVFDKVNSYAYGILKCFLNKGGTSELNYEYAPQYQNQFPYVEQWAVFHDYNNDGKSDLFTYHTSGGLTVYKNTSTAGNLSFALFKTLLYSNTTPTTTPTLAKIFASNVASPGIADIDNDGDPDIIGFSSTGFQLEYHKNKSVELYGSADSLVFELNETTWGDINENNCSLVLNQFFVKQTGDMSPFKTYHAGACLMCFDRDGDGDQDLLLGDISCNKMNYCENGGTTTNAHITDTTKLYPNFPLKASTQVIRMNSFPCSYNLDVDNDNKKDLIASPNALNGENCTSVWLYKNISATAAQEFQFTKNNFLQDEMIECGEGAYPVVFDADNDGLQDLIIGNYGYYLSNSSKTQLTFYKNTGTAAQPSYSLITRNYASLSTLAGTVTLTGVIPSFGDIDGDGDNDMVIGDYYGKIHWVENTAGSGQPCNFSVFKSNPFGINITGGLPYPQLIDADRDNILDLIIGLRNGKIAYYRNTGSSTAPSFSLITNAFGNVNVKSAKYTLEGICTPFMYDDGGTYKLLCGSVGGSIYYYDNIDGNLSGTFNRIDTCVNNIYTGPQTALQYTDINGDGKRDLIVGNYAGGLTFYSSKSAIGIFENAAENQIISIYPNPAHDRIYIKSATEKIETEIYDVLGNRLAKIISGGSSEIDCSSFSRGVHIVKVYAYSGKNLAVSTRKIILQ